MKAIVRFWTVWPAVILSLASLLVLLLSPRPAAAAGPQAPSDGCVFYVKSGAPAGGNGLGWGTAFAKLEDGINAAAAAQPCEVWVAKGTYVPTGTRLASFWLHSGVGIYGGFNGTETARAQRNWADNTTILSGETNDPNNPNDNKYNVVYVQDVTNTAVLDGFTIRDGYANATSTRGGGIEFVDGSPTLANLYIAENNADDRGGGIDINYGSPTLTHITVTNNYAANGGGIYVGQNSNPYLSDVRFYNNVAAYGASLYVDPANTGLTISNSIFDGNTATQWGGGVLNAGHATLDTVTFYYNHAPFGAGMGADSGSSSTLTNLEFTGNQATSNGGGMYIYGASLTLTNAYFTLNSSTITGGGMSNWGSSPTLTNVTFSKNTAVIGGGAIYTFGGGHSLVRNSILWGDSGGEILNSSADPAGSASLTYSLAQGCNPGGSWNAACGTDGLHNLNDADPKFVDPVSGNFHLQSTSPAIDRGSSSFVGGIATDMDGNKRIRGRGVDLGPFEYIYYPVFIPAVKK